MSDACGVGGAVGEARRAVLDGTCGPAEADPDGSRRALWDQAARATMQYAGFRAVFEALRERLASDRALPVLLALRLLEHVLTRGHDQCLTHLQHPNQRPWLATVARRRFEETDPEAERSGLADRARAAARRLHEAVVARASASPDLFDDALAPPASAPPADAADAAAPAREFDVLGLAVPPHVAEAREFRARARRGEHRGTTAGVAPQCLHTNLVALPRDEALEFMVFCQRNPKPCPLLDVLEPGVFAPPVTCLPGSGVDVRTDLPRYRVYRDGELVDEPDDATAWWRDDLVTFLLGCSFTFEAALAEAGVPVRHVEEGRNVPMYRTSLACTPAGRFSGNMVVSMRPMPPADAVRAVQVTSRYPHTHGAPVHMGDPGAIGVGDLGSPDWGDAVTVRPGEVPVFWACGITPQAVAEASRPPLMITHSPGCMLVCDQLNREMVES